MVIMTTMADNEIVLRIMAAIGFTLHYIKRLGGRDRDGVVGTLTVDDWEASPYNAIARRKKFTEHSNGGRLMPGSLSKHAASCSSATRSRRR